MKRFLALAATAMLALGTTMPAQAVLLNYRLTGDINASWQIESTRVPDDVRSGLLGYFDVPLDIDGVHYDSALIYMFAWWALGGVEADLGLDETGGATGTLFSAVSSDPYALNMGQIYTGPESSPTLLTGEWDFVEYDVFENDPLAPPSYHLSVSAVPEPAGWLLMTGGLGLVGMAMRRSRAKLRPA